jgi:hypothetical protein
MLLSRYQMDIEYFLNFGNRSERNLFFDTKEEHIEETVKLWEAIEPKPEWLTAEQLTDYKTKMLNN